MKLKYDIDKIYWSFDDSGNIKYNEKTENVDFIYFLETEIQIILENIKEHNREIIEI